MEQTRLLWHRSIVLLTACLVWIVGPANALSRLLGAAPGTVAWKVERPGSRWGTPAAAPDGSIYAVAAPPSPGRSVLVALQPEGAERWSAELAPGQYYPPMVNSTGNVIVTRTNGAVAAFSREGTPLWSLALRLSDASVPVLQADDSVHLGGNDLLRPATYAIIAADGTLKARGPMETLSGGGSPEPVSGLPPHIGSDGTVVYFTFGSFYLSPVPVALAVSNAFPVFVQRPTGAAAVGPGDRMAIPQATGLSLRTADGQEFAQWRGGEVTSSPVADADGTLFFGSVSNRLHAVSESGAELWSVDTGDVVRSTPVVLEGGAVAAVTASGRLFAVDASGALLWELNLPEPVTAHLNMLSDGRILVGGDGGTLWCVESGSLLADAGWPKWQGDPANRGRSLTAPVPLAAPDGVVASDQGGLEVRWRSVPGARSYRVWRDARPEFSSAELVRSTSFPAILDFGIRHGVEHFYRVEAVRGSEVGPPSAPVSAVSRKLLWRKVVADTTSGIAAQHDGTLIVTAGLGEDRWLMALDPDGVERWRRPLTWPLYQPPLVTADDTIWVNAGHELHQFKSDGTPGVTIPSGPGPGLGLPGPLAVGQEGALYVVTTASQRAQLLALDPSSGAILARSATISPGMAPGMMLAGRDGSLLVLSDASVYCHEPNTRLRWTRRGVGASGNVSGAAVLTGGDYVVATAQGLVRLRPSGEPVWTNAFPRSQATPFRWPALAVDRNDVTYVGSRSALRAVTPDGELRWESTIRGLGSSAFQPILDSRDGIQVLFGGVVRRLDLEGAEVSEVNIGADLSYSTSAVLDNRGRLFLQSDNGVLTAVDVGAGVAEDAPWPLPRRDAGNRASLAGSAGIPPSPTGVSVLPWVGGNRVQWQASGHLVRHEIFRSAGGDFSQAVRIGDALASDEFFDDPGADSGQGYYYWVVASNRAGSSGPGAPAPSAGQAPPVRSRTTIPGISTRPVLRPDHTVVVADNAGRIIALDLDGRILWTNQVSPRVASAIVHLLAADDGSTLIKSDTGIHQLAADGLSLSRVIASPNVSMCLGSDGLLRVATADRVILRAPDGTEADSAPTGGVTDPHGAVRADGLILTSTTTGSLRALDLGLNLAWAATPVEVGAGRVEIPAPPAFGLDGSTYTSIGIQALVRLGPGGQLRWRQPLGPDMQRVSGSVLGPLDRLLFTGATDRNAGRVLLANDAATGEERWRFRSPSESGPPFTVTPAVAADDTVLFGIGDILWALDGTTGGARWGFQGNGRVGDVVLHGDGSIVFAAGDELIVLRGSSPPAFSGWPMARHDARGTAGQGVGGGRPVLLTRPAGEPGGLQLESSDGTPFLPLVSENLTVWRPATGRFELQEASSERIVPRFLPEVSGDRQFFRLLGP